MASAGSIVRTRPGSQCFVGVRPTHALAVRCRGTGRANRCGQPRAQPPSSGAAIKPQSVLAVVRGDTDVARPVPPSPDGEAAVMETDAPPDVGGQATSREALFNCVNILLGCGILSIPYALHEGGWAAFGVLLLMGLSTNYTGKVLIECQEYYARNLDKSLPDGHSMQMQGRLMSSYEDIAEASFGKFGRDIMTAVLYTELLGTCALFLILQKDHMRLLLDAGASLPAVSDVTLLGVALAVVLPTTFLPDLAALSYIGFAGVLSALSVTGILGFFFLTTPHATTTDLVHLHSLPVTFGLLAFVFAGHAVFPAIYKGMRADERHKFPQVLDTTYLLVLAVCVVVGACGYATFGDATLEEVTLNLPPGALQIASVLLVLVSPFAKFALTLEPVAQGADAHFGVPESVQTPGAVFQRRVIRSGLAGFSLVLATKVPFFGVFMSLLGAFLTLSVSVLFPCLAHLKLNWSELSDREKAVDAAILAVGSFATVMGTATAFHSLPSSIQDNFEMLVPLQATANNHAVFKTLVCGSVCNAV